MQLCKDAQLKKIFNGKMGVEPWPVSLCCILLYHESYQHLGGDWLLETKFCTHTELVRTKWISCRSTLYERACITNLKDVMTSLTSYIYILMNHIHPQESFPWRKWQVFFTSQRRAVRDFSFVKLDSIHEKKNTLRTVSNFVLLYWSEVKTLFTLELLRSSIWDRKSVV